MSNAEVQVAAVLFRSGMIDIERAAALDPKFAEFYGKVKELYAQYADKLRP